MSATILLYTGWAILLLLCWNDFRMKVIKPRSAALYYVALGLFLTINSLVYITLCGILLHAEAHKLLSGSHNISGSDPQTLWPLFIAFGYFGVGVATITIGDKVISIYEMLRGLFQGLFRLTIPDMNRIREDVERLSKESEQLVATVEDLQQRAGKRGWEILSDQWSEIVHDRAMLEGEIMSLSNIRDRLESKPLRVNQVDRIRRDIDEKITELSAEMNSKIKKYLVRFIHANDQDQSAIEEILISIGVRTHKTTHAATRIPLYRAFVFSLIMGISLGCFIAKFSKEGPYPLQNIWALMLAMAAFGTFLSLIVRLKKNIEDFVYALGLGFVGGGLGHMVYRLVKKGVSGLEKPEGIIIGASFGVSVGLVLYVFRFYIQDRLPSLLYKYISVCFLGGIGFVVVAWVNPLLPVGDFCSAVKYFGIGAIALLAVTVSSNILHDVSDRDLRGTGTR